MDGLNVDLVLAGAVVFLAYFVRATSGSGSALVAVPLLAHLPPLTLVVPLVAVLDMLASLALTGSGQRRRHVDWGEVGWLVPGSLVGIGIGLLLLVTPDPVVLLTGLGLLSIAFGVRQLLGPHAGGRISRWWALPAGAVGGGTGAAFATGSPPFVICLGHRLYDKG